MPDQMKLRVFQILQRRIFPLELLHIVLTELPQPYIVSFSHHRSVEFLRHRDQRDFRPRPPRSSSRRLDALLHLLQPLANRFGCLRFAHSLYNTNRIFRSNSSSENFFAAPRIRSTGRLFSAASNLRIAPSIASSSAESNKNRPSSGTISSTPPRPKAITALPLAIASTAVIPKSSSPAITNALHRAYSPRNSSSVTRPQNSIFLAALFRSRLNSGPSPAIFNLRPLFENVRTARSTRLYGTSSLTIK